MGPIVLVLCALPAQLQADTLITARGQAVVEVAHEVRVDIGDGVAELRVRRSFENRGSLTDQVEMDLELPPGAAATGLRIKGKDRWYQGMLMEARMAAVVYESLTGFGPWNVKDPAILFWNDLGHLGLFVFPVLPGQRCTIEYTLLMPLAYRAGRYYLKYPAAVHQAELALPAVTLRSPGRKARFTLNGSRVAANTRVPLTVRMIAGEDHEIEDLDGIHDLLDEDELEQSDDFVRLDGEALITATAPPIDTVAVRYATFTLSPGKTMFRFAIDTAAELQPRPRHAQVVFVIDASRSFGADGVEAALELGRAYVSHLDDARYEVVLFRRQATRLFDRFISADEWQASVEAARARDQLATGNGSFLERGLDLASELLADGRGAKRVVLITDARMRERYHNRMAVKALQRLAEHSVVHLVDLTPGGGGDLVEAQRDDDHDLASVALAHGGMLIALDGGSAAEDFSLAALELVQPQRIHGFSVSRGGVPLELMDLPAELFAGQGLRFMELAPYAPDAIAVQGRVWAEPLVMVVQADPERGDEVLPALLFGDEVYQELDETEMMRAAAAGKAVSPVTSYLSVEPGTRPSTDGFTEVSGVGGLGLSGVGSGGGGSSCYGVGHAGQPDYVALLSELVRAAATPCLEAAGAGVETVAWVECTLDEIVDLEIESADDAGLEACLRDELWEIALPSSFVLPQLAASIRVSSSE